MDRGDTGFIIHESFKDLKTRRAEQEAYRKALEAQIMEKKRLQEQERERERREYGGRNAQYNHHYEQQNNPQIQKIPPPTSHRSQLLPTRKILTPDAEQSSLNSHSHALPPLPQTSPRLSNFNDYKSHLNQTSDPKGGFQSINEIDSFNEPHPAAIADSLEDNPPISSGSKTGVTGVPHIPPECMKYIQQVLPGFVLPTTIPQADFSTCESRSEYLASDKANVKSENRSTNASTSESKNVSNTPAFSYGSSSESSSVEDVTNNSVVTTMPKIHVSQTSEQLTAGVKVSRTLYKADLQKQIDERKRREEMLRKKEQEEEEKIQEKIRIEQERMQKEYEEDLRRQKEKEKEDEKKRIEALKKQGEIMKAAGKGKQKGGKKNRPTTEAHLTPEQDGDGVKMTEVEDSDASTQVLADSSSSTETIESIGEFFDSTMKPCDANRSRQTKYVDPDDRIIPTVARMLKERVKSEKLDQSTKCDEENLTKDSERENIIMSSRSSKEKETTALTSRVETTSQNNAGVGMDSFSYSYSTDGSMPTPGFIRELAVRSAPSPPTNLTGLEFLTSLKSYLESEKSKIHQRIQARASRKTQKSNQKPNVDDVEAVCEYWKL